MANSIGGKDCMVSVGISAVYVPCVANTLPAFHRSRNGFSWLLLMFSWVWECTLVCSYKGRSWGCLSTSFCSRPWLAWDLLSASKCIFCFWYFAHIRMVLLTRRTQHINLSTWSHGWLGVFSHTVQDLVRIKLLLRLWHGEFTQKYKMSRFNCWLETPGFPQIEHASFLLGRLSRWQTYAAQGHVCCYCLCLLCLYDCSLDGHLLLRYPGFCPVEPGRRCLQCLLRRNAVLFQFFDEPFQLHLQWVFALNGIILSMNGS